MIIRRLNNFENTAMMFDKLSVALVASIRGAIPLGFEDIRSILSADLTERIAVCAPLFYRIDSIVRESPQAQSRISSRMKFSVKIDSTFPTDGIVARHRSAAADSRRAQPAISKLGASTGSALPRAASVVQ